jgi:hypothetical protein
MTKPSQTMNNWYERFALLLDLGFYPTRSVSDLDQQIMECVSCAHLCDESEIEQIARHSLQCRGRSLPRTREQQRIWERRYNLWLGCRIKQARLEYGVPESLLALRRMLVLLQYDILPKHEHQTFLKFFRQHASADEVKELIDDYPFLLLLGEPHTFEI